MLQLKVENVKVLHQFAIFCMKNFRQNRTFHVFRFAFQQCRMKNHPRTKPKEKLDITENDNRKNHFLERRIVGNYVMNKSEIEENVKKCELKEKIHQIQRVTAVDSAHCLAQLQMYFSQNFYRVHIVTRHRQHLIDVLHTPVHRDDEKHMSYLIAQICRHIDCRKHAFENVHFDLRQIFLVEIFVEKECEVEGAKVAEGYSQRRSEMLPVIDFNTECRQFFVNPHDVFDYARVLLSHDEIENSKNFKGILIENNEEKIRKINHLSA